ncbi:P110/LppT family adhesin N-terminal domain [Mycoplasma sp. 'Moose RK']|uniref:P110/LppT family adhesin N-terminal domain n=1 Tax=Mycoplasma sp. 'Moose RK' TaxID=2780095 RepID=UPI0018C2A0D6|nr:P110/LppT family adhesin N-terminal domain [Mycoplasma sp. 'Moose RK']MBG0730927.1 P110/LppT family adhesin N-terminal domain [Mycoplasma sp. 'Moose RK']
MKLFKKPIWIITTILGTTIAISAVVGTAIGIKAYNNSYYSILNEKPALLKTQVNSAISAEEFANIVKDLKVKSGSTKISAKTALALAKSQLYHLDLTTFFDFETLKSKGFGVSLDFSQAEAAGTVIKKVVVFAKSRKDQTTFSLAVELKGFAENDGSNGDLSKFQLDSTKSFANIINGIYTATEFKQKLEENFENAKQISLFARLESALIDSGATLSLYNSLGAPVFIGDNFELEPVLVGKKLSLLEKDGKLFLQINLKDKIANKTQKHDLEIRGLAEKAKLAQELKVWFEKNLANQIEIKPEVQKVILKENVSLTDLFYGSVSGTESQKLKTKTFDQLFEVLQKSFEVETKTFGTYDVTITKTSVAEKSKISETDVTKLQKEKKLRLNFEIDIKRLDSKVATKITSSADLAIDLNKYERALGSIFGSLNSFQTFSIPENPTRALTSNDIKTTIDQLFELAKNNSKADEPNDEIITRVYFLDHGKYPSEEEKTKAKAGLKTAIAEAKKRVEKELGTPAKPAPAKPAPAKPAPSGSAAASGGSTQATSASHSATMTKVSLFADEKKPQNTLENSSNTKIGTNVWTTINAASIYDLKGVKTEYKIEDIGTDLVFDFKLISTTDDSILASSQLVINNVIDSTKSAYDVLQKYNPTLFLEPTGAKIKEKDDKKTFEITDPINKKLVFTTTGATKTKDGLELSQPLKYGGEEKTLAQVSEISQVFPRLQKTITQLDSGAIYLAFSAKNISDKKQHYLLSDKSGKGIFIQKMETLKTKKPFFVVGMDYKQISGYVYLRSAIWSPRPGHLLLPLKGGMKSTDKQQILVTSGFPRSLTPTSDSEVTTGKPEITGVQAGGTISLPFEKNPSISVFGIVSPSKTESKSETQQKTPELQDITNNVYFNQSTYHPEDQEPDKNENGGGLIQENENLLLEIIKTPYSIKVSLFSSNTKDPKNYKEVGVLIYNIDASGKWNPFPNFFNLDWTNIGPNPVSETTQDQGKKAEGAQNQGKKSEGAQNQGKKAEGAQNQGKKSEGAQNQGKKAEGAQNQDTSQSQAKITLKALAVFDDPNFTTKNYDVARSEILRSFIDAYIKK